MKKLDPFVKWVGGKRQVIKYIEPLLPKKYNTYFEPFVGGGALLFHLKPKIFVISDINKELINAYKMMKTQYKKVREYLLLMEYAHNEDFYLKIRQIDRNEKHDRHLSMEDSDELKAARFIYLNKSCFNGLYRVNSEGRFNVPSGKKEKVKTHEYPNFINISEFLTSSKSKIWNRSFQDSVKKAKKGDFVYFDPPYDYEVGINGFDAYEKNGFGIKGQKKLAKLCKELDRKKVKFIVSNHNTKLIQEIYSGFNIVIIKINRLVGGKGASRKKVEEVLITNYDKEK